MVTEAIAMGFENGVEEESGSYVLDAWCVSLVLVKESFLQSATGLGSGGFAPEFGTTTGSGEGFPGGGGGPSAVAGFEAAHPILATSTPLTPLLYPWLSALQPDAYSVHKVPASHPRQMAHCTLNTGYQF
jgi:hypothetical protein